jgi:hypothetical protein
MLFASVSSNISRKDEIVGHSLGYNQVFNFCANFFGLQQHARPALYMHDGTEIFSATKQNGSSETCENWRRLQVYKANHPVHLELHA